MQEITKKLIDAGYRGKVFYYQEINSLIRGDANSRPSQKLYTSIKLDEIIKLAPRSYIINPRLKIEVLSSANRMGYPATLMSYEDINLVSNHYIAKCLAPNFPHTKSYITSITALSWHEWIPESVHVEISAIEHSHRNQILSKEVSNTTGTFKYYKLQLTNNISFLDDCIPIYNSNHEDDEPDYYVANHLRAIADMVYINKVKHKPSRAASLQAFEYKDPLSYLTDSMRIELENLESLTSEDFDRTISSYKSTRVLKFLKRLREQLKK